MLSPKSLIAQITRKNADKKKPSFNSFYIEDLQTIKRKGMNETLHQFIMGKDLQVDIEQDHQAIESLLSPKNLPDGRWPSRIDHRLSLMQQVAVNQIIHGDGPVYSVNGPPGTGKTTLLQDIFAHFIVERAKQMVTYQDPTDAFKIIGKYQANPFEYKRNMYELDENIPHAFFPLNSSDATSLKRSISFISRVKSSSISLMYKRFLLSKAVSLSSPSSSKSRLILVISGNSLEMFSTAPLLLEAMTMVYLALLY